MHDVEIRGILGECKGITERATREGRGLTAAEEKTVNEGLAKVAKLKARRDAAGIRSSLSNGGNRFAVLARDLIESGKSTGRLGDLLGKAVTITEPNSNNTRIESGITSLLPYDPRNNLSTLLPREDAGDALAVQTYKMTARSVTGSVERLPTDTSTKADMSLTVAPATVSMKQFAVTVSGIPQAVLDSEPALSALLESEMRAQLNQALDAHTVNALYSAALDHGGTGTTIEAKVRTGVGDAADQGVRPNLVLLSPSDAADVDLRTATSTPSTAPLWPFGLTVVESKAALTGAPILLDRSRIGALYVGAYTALVDPYSGMTTNQVRVRAEFSAVFVVRNHRAGLIANAGAGFVT